MKMSKATMDTLKKVYEVNQSVRFMADENIIKVKSTDNSLLMHSPIEEAFPRDFNVYDLRELLSVLNIIADPVLDFSDPKFLKIESEDKKQTLRYLESDEQFVKSYTDKEPAIPEADFVVKVTEDQFSSVMKAAQTMKLDYVGFVSDGHDLSLSAFNKNNGDDNTTNNFSIDLISNDDTFKMFYKIDKQNIAVLMNEGDLMFEVSYKKISKIHTSTGKTFWVGMNANSSKD